MTHSNQLIIFYKDVPSGYIIDIVIYHDEKTKNASEYIFSYRNNIPIKSYNTFWNETNDLPPMYSLVFIERILNISMEDSYDIFNQKVADLLDSEC